MLLGGEAVVLLSRGGLGPVWAALSLHCQPRLLCQPKLGMPCHVTKACFVRQKFRILHTPPKQD